MAPMIVVWIVFTTLASPPAEARSIDQDIAEASDSYGLRFHNQDDDTVTVELDIRYTKEQWERIQNERKNIENGKTLHKADTNNIWDTLTIPYILEEDYYYPEEIDQIREAMDEWEHYTCLKFKPRTNERAYIFIKSGLGCSSVVGKLGGKQIVTLPENCLNKRTILHELGHAIGFHHEHSRPDRDDYVTINYDNIHDSSVYNFAIAADSETFGMPYGYDSVMHYGQYYYTMNFNQPTIITKDPYYQDKIGNSKALSFSDIAIANKLYKCDAKCGIIKCPSMAYVDKYCKCQCPGKPIREC